MAGRSALERAGSDSRLHRIEEFGHFGDCKALEGVDKPLAELRWKNGWRIYFYRDGVASMRILLGGKKNDQKEDIKKARILLRSDAHTKE